MSIRMSVTLDLGPGQRLTQELKNRVDRVVEKAAEDVLSRAQDMCPVDTGTLKASLQVSEGTRDLERIVHDGVEYGLYVHDGTVKMAGRPFLQAAVEIVRPSFVAALKRLTLDTVSWPG